MFSNKTSEKEYGHFNTYLKTLIKFHLNLMIHGKWYIQWQINVEGMKFSLIA